MGLTDISRTFNQTEADYTFFLRAYEIFPRIDDILGHKASPNKFMIKNHIRCFL